MRRVLCFHRNHEHLTLPSNGWPYDEAIIYRCQEPGCAWFRWEPR